MFSISPNTTKTQEETNAYAVTYYKKSSVNGGLQLFDFTRRSSVHFAPDFEGDLIFNGVASDVKRTIFSNSTQLDTNWDAVGNHTLRCGLGGQTFTASRPLADTTTTVFPVDAFGHQTLPAPPHRR